GQGRAGDVAALGDALVEAAVVGRGEAVGLVGVAHQLRGGAPALGLGLVGGRVRQRQGRHDQVEALTVLVGRLGGGGGVYAHRHIGARVVGLLGAIVQAAGPALIVVSAHLPVGAERFQDALGPHGDLVVDGVLGHPVGGLRAGGRARLGPAPAVGDLL